MLNIDPFHSLLCSIRNDRLHSLAFFFNSFSWQFFSTCSPTLLISYWSVPTLLFLVLTLAHVLLLYLHHGLSSIVCLCLQIHPFSSYNGVLQIDSFSSLDSCSTVLDTTFTMGDDLIDTSSSCSPSKYTKKCLRLQKSLAGVYF